MNGPLSRTIPGHFVAHAADEGGLPGIPGSSSGPRFQGGGAQFVNPAPQSTRERDEGPFELATWGARLLAIFVDGLIMAALLVSSPSRSCSPCSACRSISTMKAQQPGR